MNNNGLLTGTTKVVVGKVVDAALSVLSDDDTGGLQPDGSYVTPGGNRIRKHGKKGDGLKYIDDYGHTPEGIDGIIDSPEQEYEAKNGDTSSAGGRKAYVKVGPNGDWVVVNEDGTAIAVNDRNNPRFRKPEKKEEEEVENEKDKKDE